MSEDRDDDTRNAGLLVVFGAVALVVAGVIGYAVVRTLHGGAPAPAAVSTGAAQDAGAAAAALAGGTAAAVAHAGSAAMAGAGEAAAAASAAADHAHGAMAGAAGAVTQAAGTLADKVDAAASGVATAAQNAMDKAADAVADGASQAVTSAAQVADGAADAAKAAAGVDSAMAAANAKAPSSLLDGAVTGKPEGVLYFASGKSELPADASAVLGKVIKAAGADPKVYVVISGFHDETGSAEVNNKLARARAMHVREALIAKGLAPERAVLRKPEVTTGTGSRREARRVELRARGA